MIGAQLSVTLSGAAERQNRHPEALAERASKGDGPGGAASFEGRGACHRVLGGNVMSCAEPQSSIAMRGALPRHDWTREELRTLFDLPFSELIFRAQSIHREHFDPAAMQISTLLSIKTGGCPEDCAYCPQSADYETGVRAEKLMPLDTGARGSARRPRRRREPFLHGRGVAFTQGARPRPCLRHGRRRQIPGAGDLRDARHAERRTGAKAQSRRPRLLQSQSRQLA